MRRFLDIGCVLLAATVTTASLAGAQPATFQIVVVDGPGEGFNDATPAAPVGGNTGTTRGQQRLKAFEYAASIWAARLRSAVPIKIRASFDPLGANVLGSAGPRTVEADFTNAPQPGVWYAQALANSLAGIDLSPDFEDLSARFSSDFNFYLGLDNHAPAGQPDLVAVLLHEFAHGLGFTYTADRTSFDLLGRETPCTPWQAVVLPQPPFANAWRPRFDPLLSAARQLWLVLHFVVAAAATCWSCAPS